jgi:hypothetical protein
MFLLSGNRLLHLLPTIENRIFGISRCYRRRGHPPDDHRHDFAGIEAFTQALPKLGYCMGQAEYCVRHRTVVSNRLLAGCQTAILAHHRKSACQQGPVNPASVHDSHSLKPHRCAVMVVSVRL